MAPNAAITYSPWTSRPDGLRALGLDPPVGLAVRSSYPHRAPSRYPFAAQSGLAPGNLTLFPAFANWLYRTPP